MACSPENTVDDQTAEPSPTSQDIMIAAQDTIEFKPESDLSWVDLTDAVVSDHPNNLILSEVSPLSDHNHCNVLQIKGLKYQIETSNTQVCRYSYHVETITEQYKAHSQGVSQVVVSDTNQDTSPIQPMGQTVYESSTVQIDISANLPPNYYLDSTSIELIGDTSTGNLGTAEEVEKNVINYTAPANTNGNVEIYYSAIDDLTLNVKPGVIYVTLGNQQAGLIANEHQHLEEKILAEEVSNSFNIDVARFVTSPENQSATLVEVYTTGQGTRVITPNSTEFSYKPNYTGNHYLTYVVKDEKGSFAMGGLIFKVVHYRPIYDSVQKLNFYPTYTLDEIVRMGSTYSMIRSESGATGEPGRYPVFDKDLAKAYCVTEGKRLAEFKEMHYMHRNVISPNSAYTSEYRWPTGSYYVVDDDDDRMCSLITGNCFTLLNPLVGYISCVEEFDSNNKYSFEQELLRADWKEETYLLASTFNEESGYYSPLPAQEYQLYFQISKTEPAGLSDLVKVQITNNVITVYRLDNSVQQATLELQSPNIYGNIDKATLLVGHK